MLSTRGDTIAIMMSDATFIPLCSVIVPLFNKERTIKSCLESVQAQTITSFEILVVDDGSTDGSVAAVEAMVRDDERIVLIQEPHRGPSAARNIGLETAIGAYVCFLDADDCLDPCFLEELIAVMQREHTDVARCAQFFIEKAPDGSVLQQRVRRVAEGDKTMPGSLLYRRLFADLEVPLMSASSALYKRDFLQRHRLRFNEELRHLEDILFVAQVYAYDTRIAFSREPLYHYLHDVGASSLSEERAGLASALEPFVTALEQLESGSTVATTERQARLHYCAIVILTTLATSAPENDPCFYRDFLRSEVVVRIIAVIHPNYLPNSLLVARGLARLDYPQLLNTYCAQLIHARRLRKAFQN